MQSEREREVAEVVGRELQLPARRGTQSGSAITPALLISTCSGPSNRRRTRRPRPGRRGPAARVERWLAGARGDVGRGTLAGVGVRTASVTSAPAPASARAVSTPMPDDAAGDDRALAVEVDPGDHFGGGRVEAERGGNQVGGDSSRSCISFGHGSRRTRALVVAGGGRARIAAQDSRIVVPCRERIRSVSTSAPGGNSSSRRRRAAGSGGRRRVPGLRREGVAILAGVSADYYVRLEQGRDQHPSAQVLDALARALRPDGDATAHLHSLAAPPMAAGAESAAPKGCPRASSGCSRRGAHTPAYVYGRYMDVLAANALATASRRTTSRGTTCARRVP